MALNDFTLQEAIEVCIALRDRLICENAQKGMSLYDLYREPDALAQIINIAESTAEGEE